MHIFCLPWTITNNVKFQMKCPKHSHHLETLTLFSFKPTFKPTMKWCFLLSSVAHTGNTIIELASTTSPIIKRHNLPLLHHHLNTLHSLQNLFFVSYNEVQHRSARWHTIVSDLSHSHQNLVNSLHTHQTSTTSSHMHQTSDNSVVHPPNLDNSIAHPPNPDKPEAYLPYPDEPMAHAPNPSLWIVVGCANWVWFGWWGLWQVAWIPVVDVCLLIVEVYWTQIHGVGIPVVVVEMDKFGLEMVAMEIYVQRFSILSLKAWSRNMCFFTSLFYCVIVHVVGDLSCLDDLGCVYYVHWNCVLNLF